MLDKMMLIGFHQTAEKHTHGLQTDLGKPVPKDIHQSLDLKGLKCPLPVLKTRKAMTQLSSGDRIEVVTSDPMAFIDIPHFCNEHGHKLEATDKDGEAGRFVIVKA